MELDRLGVALEAMEQAIRDAGFANAYDIPDDPNIEIPMPNWLVTMLEQITGIPADSGDMQ